MKPTEEFAFQITAWLESGQDYERGVTLFIQFSNNQTLKKLFPGREAKFRNKLTYELTKLAGKPFNPLPVPVKPEIKPSSIPPVALPEQLNDTGANLPKIIGRVIKVYNKLYNERSIAHNSLKAIPADNRPENVAARQAILDKISKGSARMDELYLAKDAYDKDGILPVEEILFRKKSQPAEPASTPEEIQRQLLNAKKNLSKDLNLLEYQTVTKQAKANPMPTGPKRSEIEKRIANRKKEIATLQKNQDGFNSNQ